MILHAGKTLNLQIINKDLTLVSEDAYASDIIIIRAKQRILLGEGMNITISKSNIIWSILMVVGAVLLVRGIITRERFKEAVDFTELSSVNWEYGDYVIGDITSFLKFHVGGNNYRGDSGEYNSYLEYTVPVASHQYARLYVSSLETKDLLEKACNQDTYSIPFVGVLSKSNFSVNYSYYDSIEGLKREQIITDFVVVQTSEKRIYTSIIAGAEIVVICLVLRFMGVLLPIFTIEKPIEVSKEKRYTDSYNHEYEIEREIHKMEQLQIRQGKLKKDMILGIVLFVLGLVLLILGADMGMLLPGFILLFVAIPIILSYLIHLDNGVGHFLSMFSKRRSIPTQIEECRENIQMLCQKSVSESTKTPIYQKKIE